MGFEKVEQKSTLVIASKMEIGANIEAYVVDFVDGKYGLNVIMENKEGETFTLAPSGTLKYAVQDHLLKPGVFTRIVRIADIKIKGLTSSAFEVFQDADDTITTNLPTGVTAEKKSSIADRVAKVKDNMKTAG